MIPVRMEPGTEDPLWVVVLASVFFLLSGAVVLGASRQAALTGVVLPGSYRGGWMSPLQGYVAGSLCIAFGLALAVCAWQRHHK